MPDRVPSLNPCTKESASKRNVLYNKARQADQAFYTSTTWKKLRKSFVLRNPLCFTCLQKGIHTPTQNVHHILDRKTHRELELDEKNLQAACVACHNKMRGANRE